MLQASVWKRARSGWGRCWNDEAGCRVWAPPNLDVAGLAGARVRCGRSYGSQSENVAQSPFTSGSRASRLSVARWSSSIFAGLHPGLDGKQL